MKIYAVCHTCRRKHLIDFDPVTGPGAAFSDWLCKHPGPTHSTGFIFPERSAKKSQPRQSWLQYLHNADVKTAYGASAAYTISLASLATSSTFVAGRESDAVSNTTNLYLDYLVAGRVTVGTTPTISTRIEVYAYGSQNDTPTYPDVFDGTDSAETVTSAEIRAACLRLLAVMIVDATTSDRVYPFAPVSLAACYGGTLPKTHGLFVTHNTAVNLNATGGNHVIDRTPVYATVA